MVEITDHAIVRWLERVKGVDIAKIREEMQSPALKTAQEFGCPVVIGRNGEGTLVRDGVVVTVFSKRFGKMDRRMKG